MNKILQTLIDNYPKLSPIEPDITRATSIIANCYRNGGKVLLCGNGGSAADCEHIVGELMKGFLLSRTIPQSQAALYPDGFAENLQGALPAIALTGHNSLSTACSNDVHPKFVFAQQVYGLGSAGDVLVCISTSGNARNVANAAITAKVKGMSVIGMTGDGGGELAKMCDCAIKAPADDTYRVQEYHLPIYHAICAMLEQEFFGA